MAFPFAVDDALQVDGHQHERGLIVGKGADHAGTVTHLPC